MLQADFTAHVEDLNRAIHDSFGWQDRHLWEFQLPGSRGAALAGTAGSDPWDYCVPNARLIKLKDYFWSITASAWCEYVYDLGDDWLHDVKCCGLRQFPETFKRRLLNGGGMTLPEDCGGPPEYERMVAFRRTGVDIYGDDEVDLGEWLGDWQPDGFDLGRVKEGFDR